MTQSIDQLHLLILNVGYALHDGDWNWKEVTSPFARLYYVTEGGAQILFPNKVQELKPHHLYFIPAFVKHSYRCDSRFAHYYLHLYESHQTGANVLDEWDFPLEVAAQDIDLVLLKRLCAMNPMLLLPQSDPSSYDNKPTLLENIRRNQARPFCDRVESRGIVYQLIARFLKDATYRIEGGDDRVKRTMSYIRSHFCEMIAIDTLSEMACLSKDHFIRLFKREIGLTPLQYINQKRIEKAQLLLITERMAVKQIAHLLAFDDYSYFSRVFKKATGVTPQQYRVSYR